jgi:hypothetical protein
VKTPFLLQQRKILSYNKVRLCERAPGAHNLSDYARAVMRAPPQAIAPNPHANLLNVYVQIANKMGLKKHYDKEWECMYVWLCPFPRLPRRRRPLVPLTRPCRPEPPPQIQQRNDFLSVV